MKKLRLRLALTLALSCAAAFNGTAATIVSVNFQEGGSVGLSTLDVTGAAPGAHWLNAPLAGPGAYSAYTGAPLSLDDSTGAASGVLLTTYQNGSDGPEGPFGSNTTPQETLFGGGLNAHFGGGTFSITGLSVFSSYDLIVYYYDGTSFPGARQAEVTASGSGLTYYASGIDSSTTAFTQSDSTDSSTFAPGNYVKFSGLTAPTEDVVFGNTNDRETLVGFQVVGVSAVPEPSTWLLLFVGLASLAAWKRRGSVIS